MKLIELLVIVLLPALLLKIIKKYPVLERFGAIALCYACGIIMLFLPINYDKSFSRLIASVLVAIAIPLILFSLDLFSVRSLAKSMLTGYGLQIVSVIFCASAAALIGSRLGLRYASSLAGMATGVYIGGTPNLVAAGNALVPPAVSATVIAAANAAEVITGGVYFLLILTVMKTVYKRFLGDKKENEKYLTDLGQDGLAGTREYDYTSIPKDFHSILRLAGVILLAVLCLASGAGLELLINGSLDGSLYIMITVSVLGIIFSFIRPVRETKGSYQIGQYLVLVFSLGISMSLDLALLGPNILNAFIYFAFTQTACIILHLILCKLFKIDGGAAIITNAAGIYGPPFIAPVAEAYGDRHLIVPGIICAICGLVIGNLLGIGIGEILSLALR